MRIKESKHSKLFNIKKSHLFAINKIFLNLYTKTFFAICLIIFVCTYFFWLGAFKHIDGTLGRYRVFANGLYKENFNIFNNIISGKLSQPAKFNFDIKFENLKLLQEKIDVLKQNIKLPDSISSETVNANLIYNKEKYEVKIRLIGGEMDHFSSSKWSFRCKIKGDKSILGMKEFNLMHPQTRLFLSSWVCNEFYKMEDFVNITYDFVDIKINGENKGIYVLEEWFDKPMIEKSGNRTGIIFSPRTNDKLKIFKENNILKDGSLNSQLAYLNNIYSGLVDNKIDPELFFDFNKFAKHFALIDLLDGNHAYYRGNIIWYFNPITQLVEPIGREWSSREFNNIVSISYDQSDDFFIGMLLKNERFLKLYLNELDRVSEVVYVSDFFNKIKDDKDSLLNIIHKEFPYYNYSEDYLLRNQDYIKKRLKNIFENLNVVLQVENDSTFYLHVKNEERLSVKLNSLNIDNIEKELIDDLYLGFNEDRRIRLNNYFQSNILKNIDNLFLKYEVKFLNKSKLFNKKIYLPNNINSLSNHYNPNSTELNITNYPLIIDKKNKSITLPKNLSLDEIVVIPSNYLLIARPGSVIEFASGGGIISHSPIFFNGNESFPIKIIGSNKKSNGILITGVENDTSYLKHTIFTNLSNVSDKNWGLTGSVNFYKSPVNIEKCSFKQNNGTDDLLNLVRTEFLIKDCLFFGSYADALDADFCKGKIINTKFFSSGNDALDFSGSEIILSDILVDSVGDKAISAGEGTDIIGSKIKVVDSEIALTSKDDSYIKVNNVMISDSKIGYCAYNKKSMYGKGVILVTNSNLNNTEIPYLIEEGSILKIDNESINNVQNLRVKNILYGTMYGKKS